MVGKQKTRKSMSKRFTFTKNGKGKLMRAKASHNHRLIPKSKSAKGLFKTRHAVHLGDAKNIVKGIFNINI